MRTLIPSVNGPASARFKTDSTACRRPFHKTTDILSIRLSFVSGSIKSKYTWPEEWNLRPLISPSSHISSGNTAAKVSLMASHRSPTDQVCVSVTVVQLSFAQRSSSMTTLINDHTIEEKKLTKAKVPTSQDDIRRQEQLSCKQRLYMTVHVDVRSYDER